MVQIQSVDHDKLAIVVVGYNRVDGLRRLLDSLVKASYTSSVPLFISIDASGNQSVYSLVDEFVWPHGNKYVNIQEHRLGLKDHIFQCISLSEYFGSVIILEDDLVVAPYFYDYALQSIQNYGNSTAVAGISLYSPSSVFFADKLPFYPLNCGHDVFAWKEVATWGEVFTREMWLDFKKWKNSWNGNYLSLDIPSSISNWEKAWSKLYYAYLVEQNKYFIYPYFAHSSNFNDEGGEHSGIQSTNFGTQSNLQMGAKEYCMPKIEELVKYNIYANNESIHGWLETDGNHICLDFYGIKQKYDTDYVLTSSCLNAKIIKGFKLAYFPWELNVFYNLDGDDFYLYELVASKNVIVKPNRTKLLPYFLRGISLKPLLKSTVNEFTRLLSSHMRFKG